MTHKETAFAIASTYVLLASSSTRSEQAVAATTIHVLARYNTAEEKRKIAELVRAARLTTPQQEKPRRWCSLR